MKTRRALSSHRRRARSWTAPARLPVLSRRCRCSLCGQVNGPVLSGTDRDLGRLEKAGIGRAGARPGFLSHTCSSPTEGFGTIFCFALLEGYSADCGDVDSPGDRWYSHLLVVDLVFLLTLLVHALTKWCPARSFDLRAYSVLCRHPRCCMTKILAWYVQ